MSGDSYVDMNIDSDGLRQMVEEREKQMSEYELIMNSLQHKIVVMVDYIRQKEKGMV